MERFILFPYSETNYGLRQFIIWMTFPLEADEINTSNWFVVVCNACFLCFCWPFAVRYYLLLHNLLFRYISKGSGEAGPKKTISTYEMTQKVHPVSQLLSLFCRHQTPWCRFGDHVYVYTKTDLKNRNHISILLIIGHWFIVFLQFIAWYLLLPWLSTTGI